MPLPGGGRGSAYLTLTGPASLTLTGPASLTLTVSACPCLPPAFLRRPGVGEAGDWQRVNQSAAVLGGGPGRGAGRLRLFSENFGPQETPSGLMLLLPPPTSLTAALPLPSYLPAGQVDMQPP